MCAPEAHLIDVLYEAAAVPNGWPALMEQLARHLGAKGGFLMAARRDGTQWVASPIVDQVYRDLVSQGWAAGDDRLARLQARRHAGFLTDADVHSVATLARMPLYNELLRPAGLHAAVATAMPLGEDQLVLTIEGFPTHDAAHAAVPALDRLRPHLARAGLLAARFGLERQRAAVAGLQSVGAPAAVLGVGRRMLAANALFETLLPALAQDTPTGLRLRDAEADRQLGVALARLSRDPVPSGAGASLVAGLLDLTQAEARLAHALAGGLSLAASAAQAGVRPSTARTQLKSIFVKAGLSRQSELVGLLAGLAAPPP
jgi:DNA-binding CsgD family transcriptional regulator